VTATLAAPGPKVDPEALTSIASACRDRERLRFEYRSRDGSDTRRLVEPHSLVNLGRRWYLVAWDCERSDWRTFRMDRLERVRPAGSRFVPRSLPVDDPAEFVAANLKGAQQRYQARVTLRAPAEEIRALPYTWGNIEPIDDYTCELRTSDDSLEWLALRIGMLGAEFVVHEPPELAEALRALAGRVGRAVAT
jgi:predicted DNA-binding transcriptional regulator YafY